MYSLLVCIISKGGACQNILQTSKAPEDTYKADRVTILSKNIRVEYGSVV